MLLLFIFLALLAILLAFVLRLQDVVHQIVQVFRVNLLVRYHVAIIVLRLVFLPSLTIVPFATLAICSHRAAYTNKPFHLSFKFILTHLHVHYYLPLALL